jgi:hypothetical protein
MVKNIYSRVDFKHRVKIMINWHELGGGKGIGGTYIVCDLCPSCTYFQYEKGHSSPYRCTYPSNQTAANDAQYKDFKIHKDNCAKYEAGSSGGGSSKSSGGSSGGGIAGAILGEVFVNPVKDAFDKEKQAEAAAKMAEEEEKRKEAIAEINSIRFGDNSNDVVNNLITLISLCPSFMEGVHSIQNSKVVKAVLIKGQQGINILKNSGDTANAELYEQKFKKLKIRQFALFIMAGGLAFALGLAYLIITIF